MSQITLPKHDDSEPSLDLFISHSSADADLARALVELVLSALDLEPDRIRCTSVDGYGLKAGANTGAQLQMEAISSRAFVGLLTPTSMTSTYVLFELGARWGANKPLIPLLACGMHSGDLQSPLKELNVLDLSKRAHVLRFVEDLADERELQCRKTSLYDHHIETVLGHARTAATVAATVSKPKSAPNPDRTRIIRQIGYWLPDQLGTSRMKAFDYDDVDRRLELPAGSAKRYLERVARQLGFIVKSDGDRSISIGRNTPAFK
jgi:hypothetical protein